jgi:hypothetical protein
MPSVSSLDTILPGDLATMTDRGQDDILIRQQYSDSLVGAETVRGLLGHGPFTFSNFWFDGNGSVASTATEIIDLTINDAVGLYDSAAWYDGVTPNEVIIPADGWYAGLITATIQDGTVDGEVLFELVYDPNGTPGVIKKGYVRSKGMGEKNSISIPFLIQAGPASPLGIRVTNNGLATVEVISDSFEFSLIKIA